MWQNMLNVLKYAADLYIYIHSHFICLAANKLDKTQIYTEMHEYKIKFVVIGTQNHHNCSFLYRFKSSNFINSLCWLPHKAGIFNNWPYYSFIIVQQVICCHCRAFQKCKCLLPFADNSLTWQLQWRLFGSVITSNLKEETHSMGQSSAVVMSVTIDWDYLAKSMITSLAFNLFMFMWLSVDHLTIMSTEVCIWLLAILSITSITVTSSINLNAGSVVWWSLIWIRKMNGPSHVPWGIPPFNVDQFEAIMLIFMRWRRSSKNECINRMMYGCTPSAAIMFNSKWWSTWSNSLAK